MPHTMSEQPPASCNLDPCAELHSWSMPARDTHALILQYVAQSRLLCLHCKLWRAVSMLGYGMQVVGKGLSALTEAQLGLPLDKTLQCSSWSSRPLTQAQVGTSHACKIPECS